MGLRAGLAGLCGAIAVATCCTACASPADELRPKAVAGARAAAADALRQLRAAAPPMRASVDQAIADIVPNENRVGGTVLLGKELPADGRYTARYAFVSLVGDGFQGQYEQIAVRLCVSYSGDLGRPGEVAMADLPCPPGLPGPDNGVPVDREIKLAD
ncbi:hypothetical protein AB0J55_15810 [Amycolatopsis sp. NPDC049688]|uniref:hypothetical protein n=1 Tax=Amycolatopsis sp. NPDC049688 TaxID=3154733 RepID=UPI0034289471